MIRNTLVGLHFDAIGGLKGRLYSMTKWLSLGGDEKINTVSPTVTNTDERERYYLCLSFVAKGTKLSI